MSSRIVRLTGQALRIAGLLILLAGAPLPAQEAEGPADPYVTNHNLKGVIPFGSYQISTLDAVNLATGGLEVTIPLGSRAGRGLDVSRTLTYSSKVWNAQLAEVFPGVEEIHMLMTAAENRDFRERRSLGELQFLEDFEVPCPNPMETGVLRVRSNFIYRSAQGGTFRFPNRVVLLESGFCNQTDIYEIAAGTSDSGVMLLETPSDPFFLAPLYTLRFKDGSIERFASASGSTLKSRDANGNFLGNGLDTLGRSLFGDFRDSQGNPVSYTLTRLQTPVSPSFPSTVCSGLDIVTIPPGGGSFLALHQIDLPNGLSYSFQYDAQFGELTRIDLPAGGYIRYEYATLPAFDDASEDIGCKVDSRRVVLRAVSRDGTPASEEAWSYAYSVNAIGQYVTEVTEPEGNVHRHTFQDGIHERITEVLDAAGQVLRRETRTWDASFQPVQSGQALVTDPEQFQLFEERNWRIAQTDTEWVQQGLVSRRTMLYDSYMPPDPTSTEPDTRMNVKAEEVFDWGQGAHGPLLRRSEFDYLHEDNPSYEAAHIWDRPSLQTVLDSDGGIASQTRTSYDDTALTSSTAIQHEDPGPLRGNPTTVERWLNTESRWISTQNFFDQQGNLVQTKDPKGFDTFFGYADDWEASPACPPPGQTRAFATSTTNALGHVNSWSHYSCSSLTQSVTDANGRSFSFEYDLLDRLKRVDSPDGGEHVRFYSDVASDLSAQRSGQPVFRDAGALPLRSKSFTLIESGLDQVDLRILDGLGRIQFQAQKNGSAGGLQQFDYVMTGYDGNGRVSSTSNPLSLADFSDLPNPFSFSAKTRTFYDALDRVVEVETPDGQSVLTSYSENQTTVTDQVGASRRSRADALGRIVQVREPDPLTGSLDSGGFSDTLYSYDPLDNLSSVMQGLGGSDQDGSGWDGVTQSRSFLYDSLSRLIQESHPESGTVRYAYDDNGNLVEKVDARGRKAENDYDVLNRIVSTSYSAEGGSRADPTPPVSYLYDGSTSLNRRGRLRSATDGAGTSTLEYDSMGRISRSVRTTRGKTLTADYSYTFLGGVETASYQGVNPSGYTLIYGYDEQGRQTSLSDGGGTQFVTGYRFEHFTFSALEQTFYANGVEESVSYNDRLQQESRTVFGPSFNVLMDLSYDFNDFFNGGNNGNISGIDDLLTGESRIFFYDALNRLTDVGGMPWGIDYSYDRFGNRLSAVGSASTPNFQNVTLTVDPSTNRIVDPGWEYDAAGNLVEDGGLHHFRWDSAGRLVEMGPPQPSGSGPPGDDGRCNGEPGCPPPPPPPPDPDPPLDDGRSSGGFKAQAVGTMLYEYDYADRRVVKDEGGTGRIYFWDEVLGEVIWEFPLEAPASQDVVRGFLNGRLVIENDTRPGGGLHFMHRDHLGTSKLMTDFFSGAKVCDETYHPFGQVQSQQPSGCNGHVRKFTGKERDPESGMDYFGARYSDKVIGRFISVDPLLDSAVLELPQSWNRYAYVLNQPLKLVDPDGRQVAVSRRQLEEQIRLANEAIDAIPLLPEGFKVALKFLFVPSTPEEVLMQSLPFPSAMAGVGVSKLATSQLGAARVRKVAEIIGGTALESADSQGLNVVLRNVGRTDVDVLGPLGELIVVGGPAKASNLSNLGQKLMILKEAAKEKGVQAIAFFTEDTPEEVLKIARRWLGEENVRLFEDIVNQ